MISQYTPKAVVKAAAARASLGSGKIILLGRYKGSKVYIYEYKDSLTIGLPEIYISVGPFVKVVKGLKALNIIMAIKTDKSK